MCSPLAAPLPVPVNPYPPQIVLKNSASINVTLHPHGVRYDKGSEGAPYEDGTPLELRLDDEVRPGQNYTYTWTVSTASLKRPCMALVRMPPACMALVRMPPDLTCLCWKRSRVTTAAAGWRHGGPLHRPADVMS